tara:strand:- start:49 stop:468 length:420 start_codon:yes stop_codon:yes gene_type:complete
MEEEIWTPSSDIPDGKCTICRIDIQGHGNNPSPVKEEGKCCDTCNSLIVLPHRLRAAGMSEGEIQSYLAMILDREKVEEEDKPRISVKDGQTVVRTKTGTTIVSGGDITINGKKVRSGGYDPRDYWRRQYAPYYGSHEK